MIDFHTHILPGIDDGSDSVDTSLAMLRECRANGINTVICSSHCYPRSEKSIDEYIKNRAEAFDKLLGAAEKSGEELPQLIPACELNMLTDVSSHPDLNKLCIGNTKFILIEMPFDVWDDRVYESLHSMTVRGLRPIIAHIDRYMHMKKQMDNLFDLDVLYQINTEAFLSPAARRFAARMTAEGHGHILGSDMHNLSTRNTTYARALKIIEEKLGREYVDYYNENGQCILNNTHVSRTAYHKLPPLKIMFKIFG